MPAGLKCFAQLQHFGHVCHKFVFRTDQTIKESARLAGRGLKKNASHRGRHVFAADEDVEIARDHLARAIAHQIKAVIIESAVDAVKPEDNLLSPAGPQCPQVPVTAATLNRRNDFTGEIRTGLRSSPSKPLFKGGRHFYARHAFLKNRGNVHESCELGHVALDRGIPKLRREGQTVFIADRVIVMNYGEKIADGTAEEVMENEAVKSASLGTETDA